MLIRPGSPSFVTRLRDALSATICSVGIAAAATLGAATLPPGFTETPLATGLFSPTAMALVPDGRVFVAEQGGTLRVVKNGALLAASFFIRTVLTDGERGLLGVAVDPSFATNHFVYIYYTSPTPSAHNRVSRPIGNTSRLLSPMSRRATEEPAAADRSGLDFCLAT